MDLYYLHYNNYYNRIVKKFDTLAEYLVSPYYDGTMTQNAAFNPNDSVETVQIANNAVGDYDYMIAANGYDIVSRWFIMESKRKRTGQYELSLRRDLFADSLPGVLNAPAFIEKATLSDDDPLIFNKEDMTVNQIKTSETLLKDKSGCPWIVGYLANGTNISEKTISYKAPTAYSSKAAFETDWNSLKSSINSSIYIPANDDDVNIKLKLLAKKDGYSYNTIFTISKGGYGYSYDLNNSDASLIYQNNQENLVATPYVTNFQDIIDTAITYYNIQTSQDINDILTYNGKIISDGNTYYKVTISKTTATFDLGNVILTDGSMFSVIQNITANNSHITGSVLNQNSYKMQLIGQAWAYTLTEVSGESLKYSIDASSVNSLQDAPYMMFAIPYGASTFKLNAESPAETITITDSDAKSIAFSVANSIIEEATGAKALYDIQILPYCPFQDNIDANGDIIFDYNSYYSLIKSSVSPHANIGVICWGLYSRFEFNIPCNITVDDVKLSNQCDMYRLCSPNWNGQFEFSAAKNGGVFTINVDCEYKPFSPYIHLNPDFNLLYGQDFNDARGLVCSGDFSLAQISDAWATYQRQNVNYQNTFNRQIQNMQVNNNIQNSRTVVQAATGTVGGIIGGLFAGGIGGAVAGGIASAAGGALDYALQKAEQKEAIDYTKDQFGYNLGNIQALPDSLTKVSSFNNNNKIWPVLEYYTCTDAEKQAFQNKIKYNGMTVMRIGTIQEFLRSDLTYIKGKFIRITDVEEDFHYINELANEFNKGVFIS